MMVQSSCSFAKNAGEANPYGYQFQSPKDVARFVDCICLGLDDWFLGAEER